MNSAEAKLPDRHRPPPRALPPSEPVVSSTNVFVNYLPASFAEADLRALCSRYGTILCAKVMLDLETGQSKCFGFVRYSNLDEAETAIQKLNGLHVGSKRLLAKYAVSKEKDEKVSTGIYITGLPMSVSLENVLGLFERFGTVLDVNPHSSDLPGVVVGPCIIQYYACHEAALAVGHMNNQIISVGSKPIHVRFVDESRLRGGRNATELVTGTRILDEADGRRLLPAFLLQ
jgi:ELAV like protein 2/3/4